MPDASKTRDDLPERLRDLADYQGCSGREDEYLEHAAIMRQAADEIDRQRAEVAGRDRHLQHLAKNHELCCTYDSDWDLP